MSKWRKQFLPSLTEKKIKTKFAHFWRQKKITKQGDSQILQDILLTYINLYIFLENFSLPEKFPFALEVLSFIFKHLYYSYPELYEFMSNDLIRIYPAKLFSIHITSCLWQISEKCYDMDFPCKFVTHLFYMANTQMNVFPHMTHLYIISD